MNNNIKQLKEFKIKYNITQIDFIEFFNINIQLKELGFFSFSKKNELKKEWGILKEKYTIESMEYEEFILLFDKADLKTIEQIDEIIALEAKAKEEAKAKRKAKKEAKAKEEAKAIEAYQETQLKQQEAKEKEKLQKEAKAKEEAKEEVKVKKEAEAKFKLKGKEIKNFFKNLDDQEIKLFDCPDCNKQVSTKAKSCPSCGCPVTSEQLYLLKAIQWLEGECKDNYLTYTYPDEVVLKFAEICDHDIAKGDCYIGETKNGVAHGKGVFCWNGNVYVGEYMDCLWDGIGRIMWEVEDVCSVYEGELKKDKMHGQGTYRYSTGDKYVGEWKDDQQHGQGTYTYASGSKYEGEWKDGQKRGQGTYTFADGGSYIGEWKDDQQHGQGTYTYASGNKYVGEWKDGQKHGQGTSELLNGTKYVGKWKDDVEHGQGVIFFPASQKEIKSGEGKFRNGQMSGKILMTRRDNSVFSQSFTKKAIERRERENAEFEITKKFRY